MLLDGTNLVLGDASDMACVVLLLMIMILMNVDCPSPSSPSPSSTPLSGGGWQLWGGLELPHTLPSPLRGGGRVWLKHQIHPIHQTHQSITLLLHTSSLLLSYPLSCYSSSPFIPHTSLLPTHLSTPLYKTHTSSSHTPLHPPVQTHTSSSHTPLHTWTNYTKNVF